MRKGAEAAVAVARGLNNLHQAMTRELSQSALGTFEGWWPQVSDEKDARFIGSVEGAWQAFQDAVIRAMGMTGSPGDIIDMDDDCRMAAHEAYERAYQRAWVQKSTGAGD